MPRKFNHESKDFIGRRLKPESQTTGKKLKTKKKPIVFIFRLLRFPRTSGGTLQRRLLPAFRLSGQTPLRAKRSKQDFCDEKSKTMSETKILVVEDESITARNIQNQLKGLGYRVPGVASSGEEAIQKAEEMRPDLVLMDIKLKGNMDGIQAAEQIQTSFDIPVIYLTAYADEAILQRAKVTEPYSYILKPFDVRELQTNIEVALYKHKMEEKLRAINAEQKILLEKTLTGSVRVLIEILSQVNPKAFGRASRIRGDVKDIATQLQLPNVWQFELAAMLSQIGCVTLPPKICDKVYAGESLSRDELEMFSSHPSIGCELLANIPRLETIARMVEGQQQHFEEKLTSEDMATLGAQILKVTLDFDQLTAQGLSHKAVFSKLREQISQYNPEVLAILENLKIGEVTKEERVEDITESELKGDIVEDKDDWWIDNITVSELKIGMIADEDIRSKSGHLLMSKEQEVTQAFLVRLNNLSGKIVEPFRMRGRYQDEATTPPDS